MYPVGVLHGRFQPFHRKHLEHVVMGLEKAQFLFIGIANPDPSVIRVEAANPERSRKAANPCLYFERLLMVENSLVEMGYPKSRFCVVPFPINTPELLQYYAPGNAVYFLSICDSWGEYKLKVLQARGLCTEVLCHYEKVITGEMVRERIYRGEPWEHLVPAATVSVMRKFQIESRIKRLMMDEVTHGSTV